MAITLSIGGTEYPSMPLRKAMLLLAREALAAGIPPLDLQLHAGKPHASSRWLEGRGFPSREAAVTAVQARGGNAIRWWGDAGDVLESGGTFWVLSNQWSWDHQDGSCREDLERLRRLFPQLRLSWTHSDDPAARPNGPVVVCRIAWMTEYRGMTAGDRPVGGGSYVEDKGFGHEVFNFLSEEGVFRGYVQPSGDGINLSRVGGASGARSLSGVTVIWVATHPELGGTRVVGWYKDATVHAGMQHVDAPNSRRRLPDETTAGFLVEASAAHLLGVDERQHRVPRGSGGMGQSNVWYPDPEQAAQLLAYMRASETDSAPAPPRPPPRLHDVEERQRIERAAVGAAWAWYSGLHYELSTVEKDNVGWDLEARRGDEVIRIEVKGTSRQLHDAVVELTPNEFSKMQNADLRDTWRLCIVIVGKDDTTDLHVFSHSGETGKWVSPTAGLELRVEQIVAARCAVVATSA